MVTLQSELFGSTGNQTVHKFTWQTESGILLSAITYGAIVTSIQMPDKDGTVADIVLGFDDLDSYVNRNTPYMGAAIGRYANRIAKASFSIDDTVYNVPKNVGQNALHGGIVGFDKVVWTPTVIGKRVTMTHLSPDGDQGYPGDLITSITYELTEDGTFTIEYQAKTTKKTAINLTNHAYFNLAGHATAAKGLYEHYVSINANEYTETDVDSIPTGKLLPVGGTAYDLRTARLLGELAKTTQLFDDNFCVASYGQKELSFVARAFHPESGRFLEVFSNQPGVQFYTGNSLPSPELPLIGKKGAKYVKHGAFCFETQNYPDAVNHENFPSAILNPGDVYNHVTKFKFGVNK